MPQYSGEDVAKKFQDFGVTATPEEIAEFAGIDYVLDGAVVRPRNRN